MSRLKDAIALGLAAVLTRVLQLTSRRAGVAVVYHAVGPRRGDPRRELVPPRERSQFQRELRHLRRNYEVVSVARFGAAVAARRRGRPFPVCVTLDDDLPSHAEHALGALEQEQVPATFFLCGASLRRPRSFWWERLQRAFDDGVGVRRILDLLPSAAVERLNPEDLDIHGVAAVVQGLSPAERDAVDARLLELAGPDPPEAGLRTESVSALAEAGCGIGFHTRRHDELLDLGDEELEQALSDGRAELEAAAGVPIRAIAYPHGKADRRVAEAADRAGYEIAFTTQRCAVSPASDPMLLGRFGPEFRPSTAGFVLRLIATLTAGPRCEQVQSR